jgi:RNA polymerase sigma-70 factor (ECF subfamily)
VRLLSLAARAPADDTRPMTHDAGPLTVGKAAEDWRPDAGALAAPAAQGFDDVVLPHLHAARRLARWLLRDDDEAEDVVQEASLRALRYFATFRSGNGRAWFLRIVRNVCSGWRRGRARLASDPFEEERHSDTGAADPEMLLLHGAAAAAIEEVIDGLPIRHRELLILREVDGLSYRQIAEAMAMPIGTVMSGLSRARQAFRAGVAERLELEVAGGAANVRAASELDRGVGRAAAVLQRRQPSNERKRG